MVELAHRIRALGNRNIDVARSLNPRLRSLSDWLREHKDEIV